MPAGSKGLSFGADTENSKDDDGVARITVMCDVAGCISGAIEAPTFWRNFGGSSLPGMNWPHRLRRHHVFAKRVS